MSKKKSVAKQIPSDFTINDCANALKPVSRVKKSTTVESVTLNDLTWDQLPDDDGYDIVETANADGTMNLVCIKKSKKTKPSNTEDGFMEYPEIVWYEISKYIAPEDIGRFARINKTTYAITHQRWFWRHIYKKYCEGYQRLPAKFRIDRDHTSYGLKAKVIRALYKTYPTYVKKLAKQDRHEKKPQDLIKRRCVNIWFQKGKSKWIIYFKFKKFQQQKVMDKVDFIEELDRIDANPEYDVQVLQVDCEFFYEVPPVMGMTLTTLKMHLSRSLHHYCLTMGFNSAHYVSKKVVPECTIEVDSVSSLTVIDWWHPDYPDFVVEYPIARARDHEEEHLPMLDTDFFDEV